MINQETQKTLITFRNEFFKVAYEHMLPNKFKKNSVTEIITKKDLLLKNNNDLFFLINPEEKDPIKSRGTNNGFNFSHDDEENYIIIALKTDTKNQKNGYIVETANERRIRYAIQAWDYIDVNAPAFDREDLLFIVDTLLEAITALCEECNNENAKIDDALNLQKKLSEYNSKILSNNFGISFEEEYVIDDIKVNGIGLNEFTKALAKVKSNLPNKEKIKKYINEIFPQLYLSYIDNSCKKCRYNSYNKSSDLFVKWFEDNIESVMKRDQIAKEKLANYTRPYTKADVIDYMLSCDFAVFNKMQERFSKGNNKNWFYYFYFKEAKQVKLIKDRLKIYRNENAHAGTKQTPTETLIRVIYILHDFAKIAGLKAESILLEKRLNYERYRFYPSPDNYLPSSYSDVIYENYDYPKINIQDWKKVVTRNLRFPAHIDDIEGKKRISKIVSALFSFEDLQKKEIVTDAVVSSFQNLGVMFSPFVSTDNFRKYVRECYPFHPAFFLITANLDEDVVYELAKKAVENAYADQAYTNRLIMPKEIDIEFHPIRSELVKKYTFWDSENAEKYPTYEHGWNFIKNIWLGDGSYLHSYMAGVNNTTKEAISDFTYAVLLLSQKGILYTNSDILPNKEWIRFFCFQPMYDISKLEAIFPCLKPSIFYLEIKEETTGSLNRIDKCYWLTRPLDYKDTVRSLISSIERLENAKNECVRKVTESYEKEKNKTLSETKLQTDMDSVEKYTSSERYWTEYYEDVLRKEIEDAEFQIGLNIYAEIRDNVRENEYLHLRKLDDSIGS